MKEQFTQEEFELIEKAVGLVSIQAELNLIDNLGCESKNNATLKLSSSILEKVRTM